MKSQVKNRIRLTLLAGGLLAVAGGLLGLAAAGCQTIVGGQIMPSAYYLGDDVEFFPAGAEDKLRNARQNHEQYKLNQQALQQRLIQEGP